MGNPEHEALSVRDEESGVKEILGLFDFPAFARRGLELEHGIAQLDARLARERSAMLEMARVRLKQWAAVATGAEDWKDVFQEPVNALYELSGAKAPDWAAEAPSPRRRRAVARDLIASLRLFNRNWARRLECVKLDSINTQILMYNDYYVLEKECVIGSPRLAARHFVPRPLLTRERLLTAYPTLPVPEHRK